jgi:DNA invertase Pin-like site-specific DNA recombinase
VVLCGAGEEVDTMLEKRQIKGNLAIEENQQRIIVIEAKEKPKNLKLRVAAYARVSTNSEDQRNSFTAQNNYYTSLIAGNPDWIMVDLYADCGVSGTSAEKRADFQRLLSDCRKGLVDRILCKSVSRFARNTKECLEIIRELKALGIGVCFEKENINTADISGELLTAIFSSISQSESESISGNMRWSYRERMASGTFIPSSLPYGYILKNGKIQIQPEQAAVVKRIFHEYLSGSNAEEIAGRLSCDQIPDKTGKQTWTPRAVRYIITT